MVIPEVNAPCSSCTARGFLVSTVPCTPHDSYERSTLPRPVQSPAKVSIIHRRYASYRHRWPPRFPDVLFIESTSFRQCIHQGDVFPCYGFSPQFLGVLFVE